MSTHPRGDPRYGKGWLSGRERKEEWRMATANGMARDLELVMGRAVCDWLGWRR